MYLYALCAGHYHCDDHYLVDRKNYDSFLMMYVAGGPAYYCQNGLRHELKEGEFALIDCYTPHRYGATGDAELYWVHFDGVTARYLYEAMKASGELIPRRFDRCRRAIMDMSIQSEAMGHIEEAEMNRLLTNLLMEFLVSPEEKDHSSRDIIDEVMGYILENPEKDLRLEDLARQANMSEYHFLRQFKKRVGTTPHDYLINCRLNAAKFYLSSSDSPVKEIAFRCGFSSESSFCNCFRGREGVTPSVYRRDHAARETSAEA